MYFLYTKITFGTRKKGCFMSFLLVVPGHREPVLTLWAGQWNHREPVPCSTGNGVRWQFRWLIPGPGAGKPWCAEISWCRRAGPAWKIRLRRLVLPTAGNGGYFNPVPGDISVRFFAAKRFFLIWWFQILFYWSIVDVFYLIRTHFPVWYGGCPVVYFVFPDYSYRNYYQWKFYDSKNLNFHLIVMEKHNKEIIQLWCFMLSGVPAGFFWRAWLLI